jgi:hypothetical protein
MPLVTLVGTPFVYVGHRQVILALQERAFITVGIDVTVTIWNGYSDALNGAAVVAFPGVAVEEFDERDDPLRGHGLNLAA